MTVQTTDISANHTLVHSVTKQGQLWYLEHYTSMGNYVYKLTTDTPSPTLALLHSKKHIPIVQQFLNWYQQELLDPCL